MFYIINYLFIQGRGGDFTIEGRNSFKDIEINFLALKFKI